MVDNIAYVSTVLTTREQRELFLWKFPEVPRDDVSHLMKEFESRDTKKSGNIEHHDTLLLMEKRGSIHTAAELRQMVVDMDKDNDHKISFLELCCAIFRKPWEDLNNFVDENARQAALAAAITASEEARKAELKIEEAKRAEELAAQIRAAAIEREQKLAGVRKAAAFFTRQIEAVGDNTKTNAEKLHEEAARRKELRDAKAKLNKALLEANKQKSAEEVAAEMKLQSERVAREEAEKKKALEDAEKAQRAARKAELNAKWPGSSSAPITPRKYE